MIILQLGHLIFFFFLALISVGDALDDHIPSKHQTESTILVLDPMNILKTLIMF
jgi:hypothetical protein